MRADLCKKSVRRANKILISSEKGKNKKIKKKNIGILEIQWHFFHLYYLCRICSVEGCEVTVFTTEKGFSMLHKEVREKLPEVRWILKKEKESYISFLKKVEKFCNDNIDLLFVNTIQGLRMLLFFLLFDPVCKKILWVRNVNSWLRPKITLEKPIFNLEALLRKIILRRYDAIFVEYPPMKRYISRHTGYDKGVYSFPIGVYEYFAFQRPNERIRFVVPGNIDSARRDYELVLDVFANLFSKYGKKIELILLGNPYGTYGQRIIRRCMDFDEKGYNITYFKKWVSQEQYDDTYRSADVVISPLRLHVEIFCREIYTVTKGAGVFLEVIIFAQPLIVPIHLRIIEELQSSVLTYRNGEDLREILEDLIRNPKRVRMLKEEALLNSRHFNLKKQQKRFKDMLDQLLCKENTK